MAAGKKPGRCRISYRCVLVADSDHAAAMACANTLREARYEAVCIFDGAAVFEAIEKRRPGLAVINYGMAGFEGMEVVRRLKANPETAETIIVVGSDIETAREPAQRAGANFFLKYPFHLRYLLDVILCLMPWEMTISCEQ